MDESKIEAGDWKTRLKAYENILQLMANPTEQLLEQLQQQLPQYLSDVNPTCQKTALSRCDLFFKQSAEINYSNIALALIEKCLGARQQNSDAAIPLVLQCLKYDREEVTEMLFNKISTKPPKHILSVLSVVVAHLASLTAKDYEEADALIEKLKPLQQHNDTKIQKETRAAIASAKIVSGAAFDTTDGGLPNSLRRKGDDAETNWPVLVTSELWKERKTGYEALLDCITDEFPLSQYENTILSAINNEKHVACNELVVLIVEKLAVTFKSQLQRRLRDYISPIINMMKEKKQARFSNLTTTFDALANYASSSPYEPPFLEYLIKMLTSTSIRLREEAIQFIIRCKKEALSQPIQDQLMKMTEDPALSVREMVSKALVKYGLQKPGQTSNQPSKAPEISLAKTMKARSRSPENRRSVKRKPNQQATLNTWEHWVDPDTLSLLQSNQWNQVTSGLDKLRKQFDGDPSCPQAVLTGLSVIYQGKTFTPKVMINIVTDMLYYIKSDLSKITDDSVITSLNFCLDKMQDKKLETPIFELLDCLCECSSGQLVFSFFYNQLNAKNPVIPARILTYYSHYLINNETRPNIDFEEFSQELKPLFTHGDQSVRKAAQDCYTAVFNTGNQQAIDYFKYVKIPIIPKDEMRKTLPLEQIIKQAALQLVETESFAKDTTDTTKKDGPLSARKGSPQKHKKDLHKKEQDPLAVSMIPAPGTISFAASNLASTISPDSPLKLKQKGSEIPIPKRNLSPKKYSRPLTSPEKQRDESPPKAIFAPKLIQAIQKTNSVLENKKGFEEIELIINKLLDKKEPNSMPFSDFNDLFVAITPWFKDYNPTILLIVSKIIESSLKLIQLQDMTLIPQDFLSEMLLLLNFTVKAIRNLCLSNMNTLNKFLPTYVSTVFLPMFPKLGADGKIMALKFLKYNDIEMDVNTFSGFMVNCIANKSDEFRESCMPLIIKFLSLPGAVDAIEKESEQFPPAKKNSIMQTVAYIMKREGVAELPKEETVYFKQTPTLDELNDRMQSVDPYLPLKILNSDEEPESLGEILQNQAETYFPSSVLQTDPDSIVQACKLFLEMANNAYDEFSLVLDIVFMWWANQAILIRRQEDFNELFNFLQALMQIFIQNKRLLSEYEIIMIVPTVLELAGRDNKMWKPLLSTIFQDCDTEILLGALVKILSRVTSIFCLCATFHALMEVMGMKCQPQKYYNELKQTTAKIIQLITPNKETNQDLYNIAADFSAYLQRASNPQEPVSKPAPRPNITSPLAKAVKLPQTSSCLLNDAMNSTLNDPSLHIYLWMSDLMSQDQNSIINALKSISAQLKKDENIFKPHIIPLIVTLINKVHIFFPQKEPQMRLCKYISFCLLTLFSETTLSSLIEKEYIQQLLYELLTHLSNGQLESVINQVLNAIIVKIIEDCSMFAFMGLLAAMGEYEGKGEFSEKWLILAIKYFETCGARICEVGNSTDICNTFSLIDQFFEKHDINTIEKNPIGAKVFAAIKSFGNIVITNYNDLIQSSESIKKLGPNSTILKLTQPQVSPPSQAQTSNSKLKPLRNNTNQ